MGDQHDQKSRRNQASGRTEDRSAWNILQLRRKGVDFVLAGSIRDDGPLPDVITVSLKAQDLMREKVRGVSLALMMATTLHAIATGNLLPATVKTVCVDINPAVVTKLTDRGTFQALGLVTDVEPFLRELCQCLELELASVEPRAAH